LSIAVGHLANHNGILVRKNVYIAGSTGMYQKYMGSIIL